ncbi:MAG: hypothetical protein SVO26_06890 [Chloroflexota bacterium]|nr:hypothetical protein [Chloroflexota bacterium]
MEDFSIDDIIKRSNNKSKSSNGGNKGGKLTPGREILTVVENFDESMREQHRILTKAEKDKAEALLNLLRDCVPDKEDMYVIRKLIGIMGFVAEALIDLEVDSQTGEAESYLDIFAEEDPALAMVAFGLGMAYERLKIKGSF